VIASRNARGTPGSVPPGQRDGVRPNPASTSSGQSSPARRSSRIHGCGSGRQCAA
jgi:hypothetical protein